MAWIYLDEPAPGLWCADLTYRDTCWNGAAVIVTIYTCHFPASMSQNVCCEKGPPNSTVELLKISVLVSLFSLSAFACWLEHLAQSASVWVRIHRAASMALDSGAWVSPIPESLIFLFLHPSKPPAVSCLVHSSSLIQNVLSKTQRISLQLSQASSLFQSLVYSLYPQVSFRFSFSLHKS